MESRVEVYTERYYVYTRVVLFPEELKQKEEHYRRLGNMWLESTRVNEVGYFDVDDIPFPILLLLLVEEKFWYANLSDDDRMIEAIDERALTFAPIETITSALGLGEFMAKNLAVPLHIRIERTIEFTDEDP